MMIPTRLQLTRRITFLLSERDQSRKVVFDPVLTFFCRVNLSVYAEIAKNRSIKEKQCKCMYAAKKVFALC